LNLTKEAVDDFKAIWEDPAVRELMTKESSLDIDDNAK